MLNETAEAAKEQHLEEIRVNNKPVRIYGPTATGLEIKTAAIAQGIQIDPTFQLSEKLGDHKTRIIGDSDTVKVHNGAAFVAVADDDNS